MKKSLVKTVALLCLIGLPMMAIGQQPPQEPPQPQEQPQEQPRAEPVQSVSGTIMSLDATTNQLTLQTADKQEVSFKVDENTKVTNGDQPATLADLKQGQSITAEVQGSKAISITISS